ncbi:hypothetical protein WH390_06140 [Candidatus Arsenophonus nilaparvatae]|uniref:hypothetical protein n=1 Tax=Candidatus Arsenophonus nilaparvatae TaxID=1247023 RepID=UPI0038779C56
MWPVNVLLWLALTLIVLGQVCCGFYIAIGSTLKRNSNIEMVTTTIGAVVAEECYTITRR